MSEPAGLALSKNTTSRKSRVLGWALWDWGTQPFNTVIITFVFSVYLTTGSYFNPTNPNGPTQALAVSTTVAGVVIALLAPVLGQTADRSGHIVRNMRWLTWFLGAISMALYFVAPRPSYLIWGLVLLAGGSIVNEIASSFYNATIDQVATERNVGKVSGFGWGMGYLGGILILLLILVLFIQPEVGLFGLTDTPSKIRVAMILCGVWTLVFTIPAFATLRDKPVPPVTTRVGVIGSYKALIRSIVSLWRTDRHVAYFLLASALFRDGLAAVFTFGAVLAAQSFAFTTTEIIYFGAAANLIAGVVTMLFGLLDDKIGPKKVILICLGVLSAGALAVYFLHQPAYSGCLPVNDICTNPAYDPALERQGKTIFWVFGLLLSSLCGPAQAASRSFLARIIPEGRTGEIFGLYTTTGRAVSFISPALFGLFVTLGAAVTGSNATQHWGVIAIAIVLAAGFVVLLPVRERTRSAAPPEGTRPDR
ncbi:MAG: MFS transporter [Propionibacteriaceae bacterium]|jgi:UMF1 family MFS transporter|nr:MFS transporter [Propionibacteriaceae bacterium]